MDGLEQFPIREFVVFFFVAVIVTLCLTGGCSVALGVVSR